MSWRAEYRRQWALAVAVTLFGAADGQRDPTGLRVTAVSGSFTTCSDGFGFGGECDLYIVLTV
eukprot:CAMPEP_0206319656 /NCGR_PEP_ID=MMETSP0106_2-20121207/17878_1 /ASSEMBLY_ACC=CAM_ASM_000206 /TAXON_ID=81532 /ORGANISM="Acanthoeca-like sp., Strain 10tr" /LENGTH=62 /DNA_ID=CAMNT_0053751515 /DNA_START=99 /DNA_END=284 /DNA_ORIENTATION=-